MALALGRARGGVAGSRWRRRAGSFGLHLAVVALAAACGLLAGSEHPLLALTLLGAVLAGVATIRWLETAALATVVAAFYVRRVGGGGADLSISDAMVLVTAGLALFKVHLTPQLRRLLVVVAGYEAVLLLVVLHDGTRRSYVEWGHRAELTAGAVLVGAMLACTGRAVLAARLASVLGAVIAVVSMWDSATSGFAPAFPLGLHKNGAGSLLMVVLVLVLAAPVWPDGSGSWALRATLVGGLLATQSRGSMLALIVAVVVWGLASKQRAFRSPLLVAILLGFAAYTYVSIQQNRADLAAQGVTVDQFSSEGTRALYRQQSFTVWHRSPWWGGGLKLFNDPLSGLQSDPHNVGALTLAEGGLVDVVAMGVLVLGSLEVLRRDRSAFGPATFAILAGSFAHGLLDVFWVGGTGSFPWLLAGMAVASRPLEPLPPAAPPPPAPATAAATVAPLSGGRGRAPATAHPLPTPATTGGLAPPHVLVVAYGAPERLAAALAGVAGLPTLVVDNSSDEAVRAVAEAAGVAYDDPGANLGFAAAVNRGVQLLPPAVDVLLLNPDAVVAAEDVLRLQARLRAGRRRLAAVAPAQRDDHGHDARVSWPYPTPLGSVLEAVGLGRIRFRRAARRFLIGSVLLLRAEALTAVGPFDEGFFLYAEETDWQRRALDRGWEVEEVTAVTAFHEGGGTSTDEGVRGLRFHAAAERYVRRWHGPVGWAVFRWAVVVGALLRSLVVGGEQARVWRAKARLYVQGPRRAARAAGALPS